MPNPCAVNTRPHLVRVSVAQQHEWMCAGTRLAYQTAVMTGIPTEDYHTPTGTYVIQAKLTNQTLTLLTGDQYVVNYWIPFDAPLFGFHDSAWQTFPYGSAKYRTDGSHGCVHMPLAGIAWLYNGRPSAHPWSSTENTGHSPPQRCGADRLRGPCNAPSLHHTCARRFQSADVGRTKRESTEK